MPLNYTRIPPNPRILVLTGAGISAESGLATFRGADGLWEGHRVEQVATPEAFAKDPALVHKFYNLRRRQLTGGAVQPNAAHRALADLSRLAGPRFTLVTQNVDDLHERCDTPVFAMHGQLLQSFCVACGYRFRHSYDLTIDTLCGGCGAKASLRPDIVWFGEMPKYLSDIEVALSRCDVFVAIGTSGNVYPAAGFVQQAKAYGAYTLEVNIDQSQISRVFDEHWVGLASEQVPRLVDALVSRFSAM